MTSRSRFNIFHCEFLNNSGKNSLLTTDKSESIVFFSVNNLLNKFNVIESITNTILIHYNNIYKYLYKYSFSTKYYITHYYNGPTNVNDDGITLLAMQQGGMDLSGLLETKSQLMTMAMAFMAFQVMNNQGNMSLGGLENISFNMEQGNLGSTVMMMVAACMTLRMIQQ